MGTMTPEQRFQWIKASKEKAARLLDHIPKIAENLFAEGDLSKYLNLLSRLYYYDTYNLLLIYEKHPQACCLASYNFWCGQFKDKDAWVLNRKGVKNGIDLVAPFTDGNGNNCSLTWHSVTVFDIAQTNLSQENVFYSNAHDFTNLSIILNALCAVMDTEFLHPVLWVRPTALMQTTGLSGYIENNKISAVYVRSDISEVAQIQWLTEAMIRLALPQSSEGSEYHQDLINCISYCLFHIWGIPELASQLSCSPSLPRNKQLSFLDEVHKVVSLLAALVTEACLRFRNDVSNDSEVDFENDVVFQNGDLSLK